MGEFSFDFSRIGYCGILSDSFAVIWCDNDPLFRRLIRFRDTLKERFFSSNGEISHVFRADGVYYKAVITRLVNNDVMCRIFPATEKNRLASSTIFNNSVDICNDALSIINVSDSLIKDNTVNENIALLSDCAARIYDTVAWKKEKHIYLYENTCLIRSIVLIFELNRRIKEFVPLWISQHSMLRLIIVFLRVQY